MEILNLLQRYTVEPRLTTTPLIRTPRYYDHFILARKKAQSVIFLFKEPLQYDHTVNTSNRPFARPGHMVQNYMYW